MSSPARILGRCHFERGVGLKLMTYIVGTACCCIGVFPGQLLAENLRQNLSLQEAIYLTLEHNPELLAFGPRLEGLEAQAITARQAPPLALGFSVENFGGTEEAKKLDVAELTLSLSSVIELGGKRNLRSAMVGAETERLALQRDLATLNLLGDLTRTFINTRALEERLKLADDAIALSESTLKIVKRRAEAGASPEAEVWRARAGLSQVTLARTEIARRLQSKKLALAAFWGAETVDFQGISGDLYEFSPADNFASLYQRASAKPAIKVYASEQRIHELNLKAANAAGEGDIQWEFGLRRFEDGDNNALIAGVSRPLFAGSRNQGAVNASRAALNEVEYRRKGALLSLHTLLRNAYDEREVSVQAVQKIHSDLLPALETALSETRKAYEHDIYSYVDWSAAQRELQAGKHLLIDAALSAHLSQALIEQLTGESLVDATAKAATN